MLGERKMKRQNFKGKVINAIFKALPVLTLAAVVINANSVASPTNGQPVPPSDLKKYRKF